VNSQFRDQKRLDKVEALKDEWIQGNDYGIPSGETVAAQKNTKKILKES
jgi:hypothetical protein